MVFYVARAKYLPRHQADKTYRWDYDYAEIGEEPAEKGYELADLDAGPHHGDTDEWTIGSSSSFSSGSISPVEETQSSLWEGETVASYSDPEAQRFQSYERS